MNRDMLLVAAATVVAFLGVVIAWSGGHRRAVVVRAPTLRRRSTLAVAVVACAAVFVVSGWLGPSLMTGAIVAGIADRARGRGRDGDVAGVERTEALASWIENVRDVLRAGNQPVGAIGATARTCPPLIRAQVLSLFARLSAGQPAESAFRRFADDLDDPLADLVAIGLLIAVTRGAETKDVLSALAAQARHQADRRRIVQAERAPMRREILMVSAIMCALLGAVFTFSRSSYLDAYDDGGGQLFLTVLLLSYGALLLWVARLASFPRPARFLTAALGGHQ